MSQPRTRTLFMILQHQWSPIHYKPTKTPVFNCRRNILYFEQMLIYFEILLIYKKCCEYFFIYKTYFSTIYFLWTLSLSLLIYSFCNFWIFYLSIISSIFLLDFAFFCRLYNYFSPNFSCWFAFLIVYSNKLHAFIFVWFGRLSVLRQPSSLSKQISRFSPSSLLFDSPLTHNYVETNVNFETHNKSYFLSLFSSTTKHPRTF